MKLNVDLSDLHKVAAKMHDAVYCSHCEKCGDNKHYFAGDKVPDSCLKCGEHKGFSVISVN